MSPPLSCILCSKDEDVWPLVLEIHVKTSQRIIFPLESSAEFGRFSQDAIHVLAWQLPVLERVLESFILCFDTIGMHTSCAGSS